MDSEYYSKDNLKLEELIENTEGRTIDELNGKVDCSAFYPAITGFYTNNKNLIPFIRVNEIQNGLVRLSSETVYLPHKVLDDNQSTISIAYPGDIVIAKGGNTLAKVGLVTDEYSKYATCRDVIILRTGDIEAVNKYYLWSFLHSHYGQSLMWRSASQTGQPHITLPIISNMHIPEFSKDFQVAVEELYLLSVEKMSLAEKKYSEAEGILLSELGIRNWIPVRGHVSIRGFNEVIEAERIDAEYFQPQYDELLLILSQINHKQLSTIANITKSIEPGSEAYQNDGIPFYRVADISKEGLTEPKVFLDEKKYYKEELAFKKDTILFSKDGSIGIAYKIEEDMKAMSSSALLHLSIVDDSVSPDYLALVLNSKIVKMQAERDSGGSIIQHWRPEEIEKVIIPIVEDSVQLKIESVTKESFALMKESAMLLDKAKNAVEIAINKGEMVALQSIK